MCEKPGCNRAPADHHHRDGFIEPQTCAFCSAPIARTENVCDACVRDIGTALRRRRDAEVRLVPLRWVA
jgi:hypothetical protein